MLRSAARLLLALSLASASLQGAEPDQRPKELEQLRRILPPSKPFDQWLAKTGELPPDFDALPTSPFPQDIFTTTRDGKPHRVTKEEWPARRAEMRQLLEDWFFGHAPPAPGNVHAIVEKEFQEAGLNVLQVRLEFGPAIGRANALPASQPNGVVVGPSDGAALGTSDRPPASQPNVAVGGQPKGAARAPSDEPPASKPNDPVPRVPNEFARVATLHCWLFTSPTIVEPAPVFLVDNFKYKRFAADALEKGAFAVCVYNAPDPAYAEFMPPYVKDHVDESAAYNDVFGKYDWSEFHRRGWSASRAVDWLSTLDIVDAKHIYIGGHSRSAKQAMVGAAFDDRIAGVIASSPGAGGSLCFRDCDQYVYGESAELLTRVFPEWVSPKVRFFAGRENKLPADMHFEYALLAPRPVLMSSALHDDVENTWAVEHMYDLVHPVWEFLGQPGNLAVRYRPGPHAPDDATYHAHSDFLEAAVAGKPPAELFPWQPIHAWDYAKWAAANKLADVASMPDRAKANPAIDDNGNAITPQTWPARRAKIQGSLAALLGEGPKYAATPPDFTTGESDEAAKRLHRADSDHLRLTFGDQIHGNLYRPVMKKSAGEKLPAIIWLAPFQTSLGYVAGYREGDQPIAKWVKSGHVVLAFDPIGTADRQEERRGFYDRHPHWSLMGKMVLDARNAIDAVLDEPSVDPKRVYLVGFGMGGMTAVFTCALDDRVAGGVSVAGFTPFRTDTDSSETGGIRRWSQGYGWLPQLGAYIGNESKIPADFDEILAFAAPKRMLVIAPTLDWHTTHGDIENAVNKAGDVYKAIGAKETVTLSSPEKPCEFDNEMQATVLDWLMRAAGSSQKSPPQPGQTKNE